METLFDEAAPESTFLCSRDEVESALIFEELIEEIQELIEKGEDIFVQLETVTLAVEDLTEEEVELIAEIVGEDTVGVCLDLSVWLNVAEYTQKVAEFGEDISLAITIPEEIINTDASINRTYYIIRIHEGVATRIDGDFDPTTGEFIFKSNFFSTYILAYTDEEIINEEIATEDPAPETGETKNILHYWLLAIISIGAAGAWYCKYRRVRV